MENQNQNQEQELNVNMDLEQNFPGIGDRMVSSLSKLGKIITRSNDGPKNRFYPGASKAVREALHGVHGFPRAPRVLAADDRLAYQSDLLRKAGGIPWKMRTIAAQEAKANGFDRTAGSRSYNPSMERHGDGRDHLRSSAYWTSQLHFMREHGLNKIDIGNRTYTRAAVAAMSMQHANASVALTNKGLYDKEQVSKGNREDRSRSVNSVSKPKAVAEKPETQHPGLAAMIMMGERHGIAGGNQLAETARTALDNSIPVNDSMKVSPSDHSTKEALAAMADAVSGNFQQSMEEMNTQTEDISMKR